MIRSIGAQCGLLMFGVAIVAGLVAGNSASTILWRAIAAMIVASMIGQSMDWAAHFVLREFARETQKRVDARILAAAKAGAAKRAAEAEPIETAEAV
jgi:hypothetical protein